MINCQNFFNYLSKNNISFFTGVPDSLLKDFCSYLMDTLPPLKHIIAANEGGAIALAAGHYLVTGQPALVYMQNSGQGNALNPLLSLADPDVYSIPMILMIGWRGEPGRKDEPQHKKQGEVTLSLFETLKIPYAILPQEESDAEKLFSKMLQTAVSFACPIALIIQSGTFQPYKLQNKEHNSFSLTREDAIRQIVSALPQDAIVVSTTGHTSRELYEFRDFTHSGHEKDFLTVGSMGHASQIALGIALHHKNRMVVCLDGDGAALMHLGSLAIIAQSKVTNYKHIILNNGAHDSVGGQPTVGLQVDFPLIAKACGYGYYKTVSSETELYNCLSEFLSTKLPTFLEVRVACGHRQELGRPKTTPIENKVEFIRYLKGIHD